MPPAPTVASGSILTCRAPAASSAQWRRTRSVSMRGQATVMDRMGRLALLFALVLALAACGSDEPEPVTVALDFVPNPVHAPIYMAGDAVAIRKPGTGPDSLKLVTSGKVELGVLDIHDLAIARAA